MTEHTNSTLESTCRLHLALELGGSRWLLASSDGSARKARHKSVEAGDLAGLQLELTAAKNHFRLDPQASVVSCYEAGRDGFWIHRALVQMGVESLVVDSSSIEVNRRQRRAKTDKIDVRKLLKLLLRHGQGEPDVFSVVRVPNEADEARRRPQRELVRLGKESTAASNRLRALLRTQGVVLRGGLSGLELEALRDWNGNELPVELRRELERTYERWKLLREQVRQLELERRKTLKLGESKAAQAVGIMMTLKGIGERISWMLATELFAWRNFKNRRQVGALLGMTATPYRSDGIRREQGISKTGDPRLRAMMVEAAWLWLRHQPDSQLSRWFHERFGQSGRSRRVGIVALARKLTIALWQLVEHGQVPHGARLKTVR